MIDASPLPLSVKLDAPCVELGSTARGRIVWMGPAEPSDHVTSADRPSLFRGWHLHLAWTTADRGSVDGERVAAERLPSGAYGTGDLRFELRVPALAPISYNGRLLTIRWAITIGVERRLLPDLTATIPIVVVPANGAGRYLGAHPLPLR
ncbi:MAG: hypothetical protein AAGD35_06645 [Actinomycetota bacterium]